MIKYIDNDIMKNIGLRLNVIYNTIKNIPKINIVNTSITIFKYDIDSSAFVVTIIAIVTISFLPCVYIK